ncbi:MAG: methionine ABC transporter ATP-binding protein, partial [Gammaproteobacteria bacterium]|nr:methionine ABC transporter ATP-binding protein [Gammaproteobacteria bacterium]
QNKLQAEPIAGGKLILRVSFIGQSARRPIIDDLIRHHNVEVNILCANLELLNHDTLGVMLVALGGKFNKALDYFQQHQIKIEVLGYVPTDDWPIN